MQKETSITHGVKWGIIIGLVYCILLFLRYYQGVSSPILLTVYVFIGYIIVLALLLITGITWKKKLGGYIEMKEAFQTMFIAIIIFELFYTIFNFVYLKYVNPDFFQKMKDSMETFMQNNHVDQQKIDDALEKIDVQASKNMNFGSSILSYAYAVCISGIFALIFALIIKKKKDPFRTEQDNFLQAQQ